MARPRRVTSNSRSSGVTQTIATTVGSTYQVSFSVGSASDDFQFLASTVDLRIDGGPRVSYTNPTAPRTSVDWERFTADIVASGATTTMAFLNGDESNNFMTGLDAASVDLVDVPPPPPPVGTLPEPGEIALLGLGLVALHATRRKRLDR